jgi:hypothetical protein
MKTLSAFAFALVLATGAALAQGSGGSGSGGTDVGPGGTNTGKDSAAMKVERDFQCRRMHLGTLHYAKKPYSKDTALSSIRIAQGKLPPKCSDRHDGEQQCDCQ